MFHFLHGQSILIFLLRVLVDRLFAFGKGHRRPLYQHFHFLVDWLDLYIGILQIQCPRITIHIRSWRLAVAQITSEYTDKGWFYRS
jgi:hypothetical protein